MRSINTLHEGFARNLTHSLGAYLRIVFKAALVSAEHLTYGEFLQRIPEVTYLASVQADAGRRHRLAATRFGGGLSADRCTARRGRQEHAAGPRDHRNRRADSGDGHAHHLPRTAEGLAGAWPSNFNLSCGSAPDQVQHLMPAEEKTLSLSFEITLAESRGTLNLVVPAVVSNALLRKISFGVGRGETPGASGIERQFARSYRNVHFRAELGLWPAGIPLGDLASFNPALCWCCAGGGKPAALSVGGHDMFTAAGAQRGLPAPPNYWSLMPRREQGTTNRKETRLVTDSCHLLERSPGFGMDAESCAALAQVLTQIAGAPFAWNFQPKRRRTRFPRPNRPASRDHRRRNFAGRNEFASDAEFGLCSRPALFERGPRGRRRFQAGVSRGNRRTAAPDCRPSRHCTEARWGEVHFRLEFGDPPSWPAAATGWIVSASGAPVVCWLEWQLSAALLVALTTPAVSAPSSEAATPEPLPEEASEAAGKLGMLMDVDLDVTLRFGGKRLLLREILELGPGSVVELDRQVQEPADLLLDGRLIARGEVVVVEGGYGLRMMEVISPPLPA